ELKLTQNVLWYARHLQAGRFPQRRISSDNIELPQAAAAPIDILRRIADGADVDKLFEGYSPPHPEYKKLKAALARIRSGDLSPAKAIPEGPVIKAAIRGMIPAEDPRVPLLRERLGLAEASDLSNLSYDAKLADAVKKFQKVSDIPVTGNV